MLFNYDAGLKEIFDRKGSYLPGHITKSGWQFVEALNSLDTEPAIEFGTVLKRVTEDGKVPYASPIEEDDSNQEFYGIAVRDVVSQYESNFTSTNANYIKSYFAGQPISVIRKGYVTVSVQNGTPHVGGQVYIRVQKSDTNPNLPIGGVEALATQGTIAWKNVRFESGSYFPTKGTSLTPTPTVATSQCATIYVDEAEYGIEGLVVTPPNAISVVYGTLLNTVDLEGGKATFDGDDVDGKFIMNNGDEIIPVGVYELTATFIPNDPQYESVTNVPVNVTITQATPTIITPPVADKDLNYGDGLFEINLINGKASVPGTFEWEEPNTRPQKTSTQLAKFVPTDASDYETIENINVTVTVQQVPIEIETMPTASDVASGAALSTSVLSGGKVVEERNATHEVAGEWSWATPTDTITATGTHAALFTPENEDKYGTISAEILVSVTE